MIHVLPKGEAVDPATAAAIVQQLEAAFAPHRCWVHVGEDHHLDFEVTTMRGDPVVALTPSPLARIAKPGALATMIEVAKQLGREHGHTFDTP